MAKLNTTIRRWCDRCQDFTKSYIDRWGNECCVRCQPEPQDVG